MDEMENGAEAGKGGMVEGRGKDQPGGFV